MNALNVADAVRYFSGVQLKDYGGAGGLKTIDVRSMGTNHTAVFYNGVELGDAQNGQVDLGKFSLDNVEEIDLYNGQNGNIFQPARAFASASSIYLQTKNPFFENAQNTHATIGLKTASFGLFAPSVAVQQKLSTTFSTSINFNSIQSDGQYKFRYSNGVYDTAAKRQNGDVKSYHGEITLNGKFKDSSSLTLTLYGFFRNMGLPKAIVSNSFNSTQRQQDRNIFMQSSYKKEISGRDNLLLNFKYANDFLRYSDSDIQRLYIRNNDTVQGILVNHFYQQEAYFSAANKYSITNFWDADLSADVYYNKLNADLADFSYPRRWTNYVALATDFHWQALTIQANTLATFVNDQVKRNASAGNKQELSPTIAASWKPFTDKAFRVRAFYKDIFRMPTFNDLYYTQIGTVSLKPEFTKQYDFGFSYFKNYNGILQYIYMQADGYYNRVKDKIVAIPSTNLFRWQMANIGVSDITGVDASANASFLFHQLSVNTQINYTYQQALDMSDKSSLTYKNQLPYVPRNSGSAVINADYKNYGISYSFIYDGERYSQSYNSLVNYVPAWYTHDVSVFYHIDLSKRIKANISFQVNNLFNQYYDVILNYPMPGRNYAVTFSVDI